MDLDQPASDQDLHCHAVYAMMHNLVDVGVTCIHLLKILSNLLFGETTSISLVSKCKI